MVWEGEIWILFKQMTKPRASQKWTRAQVENIILCGPIVSITLVKWYNLLGYTFSNIIQSERDIGLNFHPLLSWVPLSYDIEITFKGKRGRSLEPGPHNYIYLNISRG